MSKSKNKGKAKKPNNSQRPQAKVEKQEKTLEKKENSLEKGKTEVAELNTKETEQNKKHSSGFYASVAMAIIAAVLVTFCIGEDMYRKANAKENTETNQPADELNKNNSDLDISEVNTDGQSIADKQNDADSQYEVDDVDKSEQNENSDKDSNLELDKVESTNKTENIDKSNEASTDSVSEGENETLENAEGNEAGLNEDGQNTASTEPEKIENSDEVENTDDVGNSEATENSETTDDIDSSMSGEENSQEGDTPDIEQSVNPPGINLSEEEDNARYELLTGIGRQKYTVGNMPEGFKNEAQAKKHMKTISVKVWKLRSDNTRYSSIMSLSIHSELADTVKDIFDEIYALDIQFPIKQLVGFVYRKVGGVGLVNSKLMSVHSFGAAIDINPGDYDNDYFLGKGNDLRDKDNPYCIPDEVIEIFENHGWFWGGNFNISADTMHFQYFGLDFLQYENPEEPFPVLYKDAENIQYDVLINMEQRLIKLGFLKKQYKSFNAKVEKAVMDFQEAYGIEADGIVDYETWEKMINLTHDMNYVF